VAPPRSPRISPIPQQQGGRKLNEEAERAEKERKEAEEWAAKEEAELNEAMEREKERLRLGERRAQREAEENVRRLKAQQDRLRKQEEDAKRATEERHRAEEEALRAAEAGEATVTFADMTSVVIPKKSEIRGEVGEENLPSETASVLIPTELPSRLMEERIGSSLLSPELPRNNPGSRNFQTTVTDNSPSTSPSALSTAHHIEDINRITYPRGIRRPKIELNVNAQRGKFRYVLFRF
jgi:translation initiation factor 4G